MQRTNEMLACCPTATTHATRPSLEALVVMSKPSVEGDSSFMSACQRGWLSTCARSCVQVATHFLGHEASSAGRARASWMTCSRGMDRPADKAASLVARLEGLKASRFGIWRRSVLI